MKKNKADGTDKPKVFALQQCGQPIERTEAENARDQFAMRVIWISLGIACTVLGTVLVTILLR